ncbi:MAG: dockerin type I domain-containing protein [Ruminococcus sp.]
MFRKITSIILAMLMVISLGAVAFVTSSAASAVNVALNDGNTYECQVGDVIEYTVNVKAAELFEDIEGIIYYNSSVLSLNRLDNAADEPYEFCPNLGDAAVFNADMTDELRFNSVKLRGFDFSTETVLVKLRFTVIAEGNADINLVIKEMTIKGGGASYFSKCEQRIFEGIEVNQTITGNTVPVITEPETTTVAPTEPVTGENNIVLNTGKKYGYQKGDVIEYTVSVMASQLFEDIECILYYDDSVLSLNRLDNPADEPYEFCPNLGDAAVFNADMTDELRFNSVKLRGFDFTTETVLLKLYFTVIGEGETNIDFVIKEMTLKGGEASYFSKCQQLIFDGIEVNQAIAGNTAGEPENNIILDNGEKYPYQLGDTINYSYNIKAGELFEDIEAVLYYDSSVLSLNRGTSAEEEGYEFCPNLGDVVLNVVSDGEIRFNSIKLSGFDFSEGLDLINLNFTVIGEGEAFIRLEIIEMTVKGNEESYFTDGKQVKFDGIEIASNLTGNTVPPIEIIITVLCGDADQNGKVNVKDATLIQKYVADKETISENGLLAADVNNDTKVNVKDGTAIQKFVAHMAADNMIGQMVDHTIIIEQN